MNNIGYLKDGNFYYQPLFIVVYLYNMKNIITSIILIFLAFTIYAQTPSETEEKKENLVLIIKNSGGEYTGEIVLDDGKEILLITKNIGKIYINKSEILIN